MRGGEVEEGGGDSRDGTAIITDLLEEISTTQTGCSHHIEMIDNGGEGERGCARGEGFAPEEGGWAEALGSWRLISPCANSHSSSTQPCGPG